MKQEAKILKALANERRLRILGLLAKTKELSVGDIAEGINLSFRSTSRHLKVLEGTGFLDKNQVGLNVFYRLNPEHKFLKSALNKIIF